MVHFLTTLYQEALILCIEGSERIVFNSSTGWIHFWFDDKFLPITFEFLSINLRLKSWYSLIKNKRQFHTSQNLTKFDNWFLIAKLNLILFWFALCQNNFMSTTCTKHINQQKKCFSNYDLIYENMELFKKNWLMMSELWNSL